MGSNPVEPAAHVVPLIQPAGVKVTNFRWAGFAAGRRSELLVFPAQVQSQGIRIGQLCGELERVRVIVHGLGEHAPFSHGR